MACRAAVREASPNRESTRSTVKVGLDFILPAAENRKSKIENRKWKLENGNCLLEIHGP
jgi:hypothetical protein